MSVQSEADKYRQRWLDAEDRISELEAALERKSVHLDAAILGEAAHKAEADRAESQLRAVRAAVGA